MKQTLKEMLYDKMREHAERSAKERDDQWRYWFDNGGIFEAIKYPELSKPPSQRNSVEILTIIQRDIERKRNGDRENT